MNGSDESLCAILSKILGATAQQIMEAPGRYAAFYWDDEYLDGRRIDWQGLSIKEGDGSEIEDSLLASRGGFDVEQSFFLSEELDHSRYTDTTLRDLLGFQEGGLFGSQLRAMHGAGRVTDTALEAEDVLGKIAGGTSLLEAARALFMLRDGDALQAAEEGLVEDEDEEGDEDDDDESNGPVVDEEWSAFLAGLFDEPVATHLGFFFHAVDAARYSGGAHFDEEPNTGTMLGGILPEVMPGARLLATWSLGEGQGERALIRLPDKWTPPVPPFEGESLIRKMPVPSEPVSLDFMDGPPADILRAAREKESALNHIVRELDELSLDEVLAEYVERDQTAGIVSFTGQLCQKGLSQAALVLLKAMEPHTSGPILVLAELNRSVALTQLNQHAAALEASLAATKAFEAQGNPDVPEWIIHKNTAWYAYRCDQQDVAEAAIERALKLAPDEVRGEGTLAAVRLAGGNEAEAREVLEGIMSRGVDPMLDVRITSQPMYRELALTYGILVELTPEEAAERGIE